MSTNTHVAARCALFVILCCGALTTTPGDLFAQEPVKKETEKEKQYKQLTDNAQKKYAKKDYAGAIKDFQSAYSIKAVPNIIYNIGRLYEKMGNFEEAVRYYQQFVNQPDIELSSRQDAVARIKTLKDVLALRKKDEPVKKKEVKVEKPKEKKVVVVPKPKPAEPDYTVAYVMMGSGAVAILAGAGFTYMASSAHQDFNDATTLDDRRSAASSGQIYAPVADGLLIGGGLLAVAGAVVYALTGPEQPSAKQTAQISPSIGPDRVAIDVSLRF